MYVGQLYRWDEEGRAIEYFIVRDRGRKKKIVEVIPVYGRNDDEFHASLRDIGMKYSLLGAPFGGPYTVVIDIPRGRPLSILPEALSEEVKSSLEKHGAICMFLYVEVAASKAYDDIKGVIEVPSKHVMYVRVADKNKEYFVKLIESIQKEPDGRTKISLEEVLESEKYDKIYDVKYADELDRILAIVEKNEKKYIARISGETLKEECTNKKLKNPLGFYKIWYTPRGEIITAIRQERFGEHYIVFLNGALKGMIRVKRKELEPLGAYVKENNLCLKIVKKGVFGEKAYLIKVSPDGKIRKSRAN